MSKKTLLKKMVKVGKGDPTTIPNPGRGFKPGSEVATDVGAGLVARGAVTIYEGARGVYKNPIHDSEVGDGKTEDKELLLKKKIISGLLNKKKK